MDTDEILYTVSEAVRRSREMQDEAREKQKHKPKDGTLVASSRSSSKLGSTACLLDEKILNEMLLSPSEALCAFLTITLHLKRAHGLPGERRRLEGGKTNTVSRGLHNKASRNLF